jgi:hypothetical protein
MSMRRKNVEDCLIFLLPPVAQTNNKRLLLLYGYIKNV